MVEARLIQRSRTLAITRRTIWVYIWASPLLLSPKRIGVRFFPREDMEQEGPFIPPSGLRVIHRHDRATHVLYHLECQDTGPLCLSSWLREMHPRSNVSVSRMTCLKCGERLKLQVYVPKRMAEVEDENRSARPGHMTRSVLTMLMICLLLVIDIFFSVESLLVHTELLKDEGWRQGLPRL